MKLKFSVTGLKQIDNKLKGIKQSLVKSILRDATRQATGDVLNYLIPTLPVDQGNFRKALTYDGTTVQETFNAILSDWSQAEFAKGNNITSEFTLVVDGEITITEYEEEE